LSSSIKAKGKEPQALAAFHFAMEAGIKAEQGRVGVSIQYLVIDPSFYYVQSPINIESEISSISVAR
jgi:hypothetical protein